MTESKLPKDFPRDFFLGAIPGSSPKLLARITADGRVIVGPTEEEVFDRFQYVENLVVKITDEAVANFRAGQLKSIERYCHKLDAAIIEAGWDFTPNERRWLLQQVKVRLQEETGLQR